MKIRASFLLILLVSQSLVAQTPDDWRKSWADWLSAYPDSVDSDPAPLRDFYDHSQFGCKTHQKQLQRMLRQYPQSKIAPLLEFLSAQNAHDPNYNGGGSGYEKHTKWIQGQWRDLLKGDTSRRIPSVSEECMTAWGHYPIAGARLGPLVQLKIAEAGPLVRSSHELYPMIQYPRFRERDPLPDDLKLNTVFGEYEKVLSYYPDRLAPNNSIQKREWTHVIYPAYFAILYASVANGKLDQAAKFADEVLSLPNSEFGDNGGGESHPEALLLKARVAGMRADYDSLESNLDEIVKGFRGHSWGFHGGGGGRYEEDAAEFACGNLPASRAQDFLKKNQLQLPERLGVADKCRGK